MNSPQPSTFEILTSPVVLWFLGILLTIIGSLISILWSLTSKRIKATEDALDLILGSFNDYREQVARDFIPKSDARELRHDLLEIMQRLEIQLGDRVRDLERVQKEEDKQITELRILQSKCGICNVMQLPAR